MVIMPGGCATMFWTLTPVCCYMSPFPPPDQSISPWRWNGVHSTHWDNKESNSSEGHSETKGRERPKLWQWEPHWPCWKTVERLRPDISTLTPQLKSSESNQGFKCLKKMLPRPNDVWTIWSVDWVDAILNGESLFKTKGNIQVWGLRTSSLVIHSGDQVSMQHQSIERTVEKWYPDMPV